MTDRDSNELQRLGIDPGELGRMRDAFAAIGESAVPRADCPDADAIWSAARREIPAAEIEDMVDHLGSCGVCAEAWRIAASATPPPDSETRDTLPVAADVGASGRHRAERAPGTPWPWWLKVAIPLGAAAMLMIYIGVRTTNPLPEPTMRGAETEAVVSTVDGPSLPRDSFRLSWNPGPEGAVYELDVTVASSNDLRPIATVRNLTEATYVIPPETLADLPAGTALDWQVVATYANGDRVTSRTFTTTIR